MTTEPEILESVKWASSALYIGGGDSAHSVVKSIGPT